MQSLCYSPIRIVSRALLPHMAVVADPNAGSLVRALQMRELGQGDVGCTFASLGTFDDADGQA